MADYSTTMGILQPQVGKRGDILLKFEHKDGGSASVKTTAGQGARDLTRAGGTPAVSPCGGGTPQPGNHIKKSRALADFFRNERTKWKEKRTTCKTCLQSCSLLYTVIFGI